MANKFALIVEYEGTRYYGSQWQPGLATVQEVMEEAIYKLTGERTRVKMAGRTDTGVHARGQIVSFTTESALPAATFLRGLNHYLPEDVAVKEAFRTDEKLDVRRHATSREYRYYIMNSPTRSPVRRRFAHHVPGRLDIEAMERACGMLKGKRDFASFVTRAVKKDTVREVYEARIEKAGDMVAIHMVASSFLPHQVRNTAGALIRVGLGKMTVKGFEDMIEARQPGLAGPAAPPCGLFLEKVNYPVPLGSN